MSNLTTVDHHCTDNTRQQQSMVSFLSCRDDGFHNRLRSTHENQVPWLDVSDSMYSQSCAAITTRGYGQGTRYLEVDSDPTCKRDIQVKVTFGVPIRMQPSLVVCTSHRLRGTRAPEDAPRLYVCMYIAPFCCHGRYWEASVSYYRVALNACHGAREYLLRSFRNNHKRSVSTKLGNTTVLGGCAARDPDG